MFCRSLVLAVVCHLVFGGVAQAQQDPFAALFGDPIDAGRDDRPGEDDLRFVGVRLGDLRLKNTLTAYARAEGLCIVADDLFSLLEAPVEVDEQGAAGWFPSPEDTLRIDARGATAQLGVSDKLDLTGRLFDTGDGWCLTGSAWSEILPIDFTYDPGTLSLQLDPRQTLPLEARLEREALRALLALQDGPASPDYRDVQMPYRWMNWPTADITIDLNAGNGGQAAFEGSLELAGDFLWATGRLRTARTENGDLGLRLSLERVFDTSPGSSHPSQIRFGDIVSSSLPLISRAESGRGITVTNRPAFIASVFDTTDIRGPLPEGWEAELHLEGRLIAFLDTPDAQGEYLFRDVEIRPGYNRYAVKLFGPFGETETRQVKVFAGQDMHPENEVQYEFSLIEEGVALDGQLLSEPRPAASASVQYGLSRALTVRLDAKASTLGEAAATTSLAGAHGDTHGVVRLAASNFGGPAAELGIAHLFKDRSSLDLRYAWNGGLAPLGREENAVLPRQTLRLDHDTVLPLLRHGLPVRTRMAWQDAVDGTQRLTSGVQTGSSHRGWRWAKSSFYERVWGPDLMPRQSMRGTFALARSVSGMRLRGGLDYEALPRPAFRSIDLSLQRQLPRGGFGQFAIGHEMGSGRTQASASYARNFGSLAISTSAGVDDRGAWSLGVRLAAALFHDAREGRYTVAPPGLTQTGAVRANVFDDLDGDGLLSEGDRAVPGASFIIDQSIRREETGSDGRVTLARMAPHRPVNMELSLGSLDDPFLQAVEPGHAVKVRPGQVLDLDVPLTLSGEADGTIVLVKGENRVPVAGVLIQAVDQQGRVIAEALSEYDGYFYLDGLAMGEFELQVSADALGSIGGHSTPVSMTLTRDAPSRFGAALAISLN